MANEFWDKETEILSVPRGRDILKVHDCEKNGKTFVNIREYYVSVDGDVKPGKKGISVPKEIFDQIVEAVAAGK